MVRRLPAAALAETLMTDSCCLRNIQQQLQQQQQAAAWDLWVINSWRTNLLHPRRSFWFDILLPVSFRMTTPALGLADRWLLMDGVIEEREEMEELVLYNASLILSRYNVVTVRSTGSAEWEHQGLLPRPRLQNVMNYVQPVLVPVEVWAAAAAYLACQVSSDIQYTRTVYSILQKGWIVISIQIGDTDVQKM